MLAGAEDHLAFFSFPEVSETTVKSSTWGQCPQVLASTARKVAKSTRICSYAMGRFRSHTPFFKLASASGHALDINFILYLAT